MLPPVFPKCALAAASCTLLASCLLGTQSNRGSVVDNELRVGTIYAANGDPAANARVRVYPVGHLPDTLSDTAGAAGAEDVYSTRTDGKGQYRIEELPRGEYNILADQEGQYSIQDSVYLDEKTAALANDTLDDPGSLAGVVGMQPNHDPRFALVQVLGTYNYANVDSKGRFTLAALAEGKYTLRVFTSLTDYNTLFKSITVTAGKRDTLRDTLALPYLGIPVVTGLKATFDTLLSIVSLSWDAAEYRDFSQYQVYRDAQPVLDAARIPVGITSGTSFQDNLAKLLGGRGSLSLPTAYEYRIRIKNKSDQIGLSYGNVSVSTPPQSLAQTDISLQAGKIVWDSIHQEDSIEISAVLKNPTRRLVKLVWTIGVKTDGVRDSVAMDSLGGVLSADRKLKFAWKTEGALVVGATVTDDGGREWKDSLVLSGNTAPTFSGTPDSTGKAYEAYEFIPLVSDPDHDALRFRIANAPAWAAFDSLTGILSGTPTNAEAGTYPGIAISVTDGRRTTLASVFQVKVSPNPWSPGPKYPGNSEFIKATVLEGKIYVFGDSVRVLDPIQGTWTTEGPMPEGGSGWHLPIAMNGKIFFFRAISGPFSSSNYIYQTFAYDPLSKTWEVKAPFPGMQQNIESGAVVNGVFYTFIWGEVWAYDATVDSWTAKKAVPAYLNGDHVTGARCVAVGQKIFVTGQASSAAGGAAWNIADRAGFYDPSTDSWEDASSMTPRIEAAIGAIGGKVYVAGGLVKDGNTDQVQEFDIASGIWKNKSPIPHPNSMMAYAVVDEKLFLFQGFDKFPDQVLNTTWIYNPAEDP